MPSANQKTKKQLRGKFHKPLAKKKSYSLLLFFIIVISFIVYLPVFNNGFVNLDDNVYVQENPLIRSINLSDIFSQYQQGNYHPLTILLYAIQFRLFGLNPAGYHAVDLVFHLLNVILVFYVVLFLGNKQAVALMAALLFGIHPLHTESVAWASELKDLLYSFFFLASWLCYLIYQKGFKRKFYFCCLLFFILSLLSKGMAVSLPVVFLLTDYFKGRKLSGKAWLEKLPFFALSVIFGIVAILAQKSSGSIQDFDVYPLPQRIVFACYDFITYLVKLVVPGHLSAFYPYPLKSGPGIPGSFYVYPFVFLALIVLVIYSLRFTRKIVFGILFFAITVFLVLQLLPVGGALMADRYTYIPSIGIFYLLAEGIYWLWMKKPSLKYPVAILVGIAVIFYSVRTYQRTRVWKSGMELWNNVIKEDQTVALAYNNRAALFLDQDLLKEALDDFNKAIQLRPRYSEAYVNRAAVFARQNKYSEAMSDYDKAIELQPAFPKAYNNRGMLQLGLQKFDGALKDFNKAIELKPDFAVAYNNRGNLFLDENKYEEAMRDYNKSIELDADHVQAYNGLGVLLMRQNKNDAALAEFNKAIDRNPSYGEAYCNRAIANYNSGRKQAACSDLQQSMQLGFGQAKTLADQWCR